MKMIRKILYVLTRREKRRLGVLLLGDILISIADILFLALLVFMIHFYTTTGAPGKFSFLPEWLTTYRSPVPIAVFFFLFSAKNLAGFLLYRAQCRFLFRVASRISRYKLLHYLEGTYADYVNVDSSVHIREISYQPLEFCQHVLGGVQQIITQSVLIILSIAAIVFFNARIFFLLLVILLPPVVAVFYLIRGKLRTVRVQARTSSERSLQHLQEALSGFVESNIYHKNEVFLERYVRYQREFNRYITDQLIVQGIPNRMIEVFALLGVVILVAIDRWSGAPGNTAVITIGVFMAAAYKIIPGIVKILSLSGQVNSYAFTLHNLAPAQPPAAASPHTAAPPAAPHHNGTAAHNDTAARHAEPSTHSNAAPPTHEATPSHAAPPSHATAPPNTSRIRSLRFENVCFFYNGRPVLDNTSLHIASGDFLGIAGPSGKGKTTILNLLLGFLEPDKGAILINEGVTGMQGRQQYWRNISYVKQQPFLIHDTLLNNITLNGQHRNDRQQSHNDPQHSRNDRHPPPDDKKLQEVLRLSGLTALVDTWPEKENTVIAENGRNISGGQRQRIAIARALYKNADLIILDEPFNELDEESECALLLHFQRLARAGKLVILITHNKKSLSFCNKTFSLDEQPA